MFWAKNENKYVRFVLKNVGNINIRIIQTHPTLRLLFFVYFVFMFSSFSEKATYKCTHNTTSQLFLFSCDSSAASRRHHHRLREVLMKDIFSIYFGGSFRLSLGWVSFPDEIQSRIMQNLWGALASEKVLAVEFWRFLTAWVNKWRDYFPHIQRQWKR